MYQLVRNGNKNKNLVIILQTKQDRKGVLLGVHWNPKGVLDAVSRAETSEDCFVDNCSAKVCGLTSLLLERNNKSNNDYKGNSDVQCHCCNNVISGHSSGVAKGNSSTNVIQGHSYSFLQNLLRRTEEVTKLRKEGSVACGRGSNLRSPKYVTKFGSTPLNLFRPR
jgi:hypothetical protein